MEQLLVDVVADMMEIRNREYAHFETISGYAAGRENPVWMPKDARNEYRAIARQSNVNVLPLVIDTIAQSLYVDGFRSVMTGENTGAWAQWQANRMDARQTGVHRAALTYGAAYVSVTAGDTSPAWSPYSPRTMTTVYADSVNDEWPEYALIVRPVAGRVEMVLLMPTFRHRLVAKDVHSKPELVESGVHGVPWTPVVRFLNCYDLDGRARGEVEPLIPLQDQINLTTFNLLMAQQFGAFRQKWVTGYEVPKDELGRPVEPFKAAVNRLFISDSPDSRFGDFDSTDLAGYLASRESTLRNLATIAQVPPNHLIGQMANLSAEALAAAEVQQTRKVMERRVLFGESWEQAFRLSARLSGVVEDEAAQVIWRDTEARSLAATVDALGKLTQMLGVPAQELWERIPGVTQQDVETWRAAAAHGDPLGQLTQLLDGQGRDALDQMAAARA